MMRMAVTSATSAIALGAMMVIVGCKDSPARRDKTPHPAPPTESPNGVTDGAANACAPVVPPLAVDATVCARYVEQLRGLAHVAPAATGEAGIAEHLERFPRTPAWARGVIETCEISGLATVGPLLAEAARGCAGAERVVEAMAGQGQTSPAALGPAAADALAACDCSLIATDGFVSLLAYVSRPR